MGKTAVASIVLVLAIFLGFSNWHPGVSVTVNIVEMLIKVARTFTGKMEEFSDSDLAKINFTREKFVEMIYYVGGTPQFVGTVNDTWAPYPTEQNNPTGPGIRIRYYIPNGHVADSLMIYFHGGGWVVGDLDSHDNIVRQMAHVSGVPFAAVDYRRAPEHKFPTAVHDSISATKWLMQQASSGKFPISARKFGVMGDSAGGNLAAVVSQQLTAQSIPLHLQVLIYPVTDYVANFPSWTENMNAPFLKGSAMLWYWQRYLPQPYPEHGANVMASPLKQTDKSLLSRLPPAVVYTAQFDVLRDEGEAYATLLESNGVKVTRLRYNDVHGCFMWRLRPEALESSGAIIRKTLGGK